LMRVRGRLLEARGLGVGGLDLHASAVQQFGALGELRVVLAQRGERGLRLLLRALDELALLGELEPAALELRADLLEAGARAVAFGDELDAALLAAGAAAHDIAADDGAVLGDHGGGPVESRERGL